MSKAFYHRYLPNYLRTHRKRAGFSQEELAFLLGIETGALISRYERFMRKPTLAVALALEIIFEVPAKQIFGGIHQDIERQIARRAALLREKALRRGKHLSTTKVQLLERIGGSRTERNRRQ